MTVNVFIYVKSISSKKQIFIWKMYPAGLQIPPKTRLLRYDQIFRLKKKIVNRYEFVHRDALYVEMYGEIILFWK